MIRKKQILIISLAFAQVAFASLHNHGRRVSIAKEHRSDGQALQRSSIINNYFPPPGEEKPKGWRKLVSWPEGITAWAIILTLVAIVWQANETRRAATAAEESAKATAKNIELTVHMQRGRMTVEVKTLGSQSLEFSARNIGNTNARVFYSRGFVHDLISQSEELPIEPPYLNEELNTRFIEWVAPGAEIPIFMPYAKGERELIADLTSSATRNNIQMHGWNMWVYGRICYEDGISSEMRESRFCFRIRVASDERIWADSEGPSSYWMST